MISDERTILVTGATDGLGKGIATELARQGATVILHGRNDMKGRRTLIQISKETGNDRLEWYNADFSDLDSVNDMIERFRNDHMRLDVLVNNAGIGKELPDMPGRRTSTQGHELRFAVNYLAPFALTRGLYPVLNQTATLKPALIVNVSSAAQMPIDFDDVMLERQYDGNRAYSQSKLAQIMMTFDLAERFVDTGVAAVALHPSTRMNTKLASRHETTVEAGVEATCSLINNANVASINGKYFDVMDESQADSQAYNNEARTRLRDLSEKLCGY